MQENVHQNKFMILWKKALPYIARGLNAVIYFLLTIFKSIMKGIMSQIKGM